MEDNTTKRDFQILIPPLEKHDYSKHDSEDQGKKQETPKSLDYLPQQCTPPCAGDLNQDKEKWLPSQKHWP